MMFGEMCLKHLCLVLADCAVVPVVTLTSCIPKVPPPEEKKPSLPVPKPSPTPPPEKVAPPAPEQKVAPPAGSLFRLYVPHLC